MRHVSDARDVAENEANGKSGRKKVETEQSNRRFLRPLLIGIGLMSLVALAIPVVFSILIFGPDPFRGQTFTPEAWDTAGQCLEGSCPDDLCPRGAFVRSIRSDIATPGMQLAQSRAALGPPEFERQWTDNLTCDAYMLGFCSGFGIDPDSLLICADDQGIIRDVLTIQH